MVQITAKDALDDADESGFIVPLHYDTWREMSLVDSTQMATACCYAVFNCYEVRKRKWYESGIFRILLAILIAIVSVVLTGGAGAGLLGAHMTLGTSMGFTGMTAAIVGSVANAFAALVLTTLLEKVAGNLGFLGTIISAVMMFAVGQVSALFQGFGSGLDFSSLFRIDNLIKLTSSVMGGMSNQLNLDTMSLQTEMEDYLKAASRESENIRQAYFAEFGYGNGQIDPLMFVDSTPAIMAESSSTFLTRTLMTGSELAEMSRELLYNFPEYTLTLPKAFS